MIHKINDIYETLRGAAPRKMAVASAADEAVLEAAVDAAHRGLVKPILFGDATKLEELLRTTGERPEDYAIVHCESAQNAAERAVKAVSSGEADILMKGMLQSAEFLREVFNREYGLRIPGSVLFSVAVQQLTIEREERLLFITDPGFIPLPDLETKKTMILRTTEVLHMLGCGEPKFAVLSAMETVNPKMVSSTDARALQEMNERGELPGCCVCGPLSFDLAMSSAAARHKGFKHPAAGCADVLLVPSIEVGNAVLKCIAMLQSPPSAGFVCGTKKPVVFTSRSDTPETKCNTIAMAVLMAKGMEHGK